MSILGAVAIVIIGAIGYFVMAEALRDFSLFRYPRIIAALVALLGCIGLQHTGERLATALLIPFAALLLAAGVIWGITRLGAVRGEGVGPNSPMEESAEPSEETPHNPWRKTK